ncbi:hypothetical protein P154DRAFT_282327 [Amniculicola lignicola CBS 123094]|uniref:Secreted protein n=1 Tax=Amniculicola lignicola CBS 123094 TaxID=1392246 RepID=A0A6A5W657_9PLEO|nr:hypothetical protein P154DRAFT_282327 [Amniculicola lignicola CBS 123094]
MAGLPTLGMAWLVAARCLVGGRSGSSTLSACEASGTAIKERTQLTGSAADYRIAVWKARRASSGHLRLSSRILNLLALRGQLRGLRTLCFLNTSARAAARRASFLSHPAH